MIDFALNERRCGLGGGFQGVPRCEVGLDYVCVWDLVGFHLALEVGDIAGGSNHGVSFRREGLDELVLEAVSFRFLS